jgi:hypothetical protein
MDKAIVVRELEAEIERLTQARDLLANTDSGSRWVREVRRGPRHMSAEARERIAAAQRVRWAKRKGSPITDSAKKEANQPNQTSSAWRGGPRHLSAAARARIAAAQRKRWAAVKTKKK